MDSMGNDLMSSLETSLPAYFNFEKEGFCATLRKGDINGAEEYLSNFTKSYSNSHSNIMFYLLQRQKCFISFVNRKLARGVGLLCDGKKASIPETKDFIDNDYRRCIDLGIEYENGFTGYGPTIDIVSVANSFMDEMLEMMNYLIALNPDLHKKENIASRMETLRL